MTRRSSATCVIALICFVTGLVIPPAHAAEIDPVFPTCLPKGDHGLVEAFLDPPDGWSSVRAYFRWDESEAFYFMELRGDADGRYWATLPIPEKETEMVDMYFVGTDAQGSVEGSDTQTIPVVDGCVQDLGVEQVNFSENLVVGETASEQAGKKVLGFECKNIISRIDSDGNVYPDETCRRDKWWVLPLWIVAGAAGGAAISETLREDCEKESSPSNPGL